MNPTGGSGAGTISGHFVDAGALKHHDPLVVLLREVELAVPSRVRMGGAGDVVGLARSLLLGLIPAASGSSGERVVERDVHIGRRSFGAMTRGQHDGRGDQGARTAEPAVHRREPDQPDIGVDRVRTAAGDRQRRRGRQDHRHQRHEGERHQRSFSNHSDLHVLAIPRPGERIGEVAVWHWSGDQSRSASVSSSPNWSHSTRNASWPLVERISR